MRQGGEILFAAILLKPWHPSSAIRLCALPALGIQGCILQFCGVGSRREFRPDRKLALKVWPRVESISRAKSSLPGLSQAYILPV